MKLGRRCQLQVEVNPKATGDGITMDAQDTLTIPPDLTIEFDITRTFQASTQTATFRILNLGLETRNLLQRDPFATGDFRAIQFRAGYEDFPLALCFNGMVQKATSFRRGTELVTEITAYDGGLAAANGFTAKTIGSSMGIGQLIAELAKDLPRTRQDPIIGTFTKSTMRGTVLFGNTWSLIVQAANDELKLATIDNNRLVTLGREEALAAPIQLIDSSTGLLGTPRRTDTSLEFSMLFEPHIILGQVLQLQSRINEVYNGTYKVAGFTHRGTISPVVSGECITNVLLFVGVPELQIITGRSVI
jgi:hypothetical protein